MNARTVRHAGLAATYARIGEIPLAITLYQQRLAIAQEIDDRRGEGAALGGLGNVYLRLDEAHRAIKFYVRALKRTPDRQAVGKGLVGLGNAYANLRKFRQASKFYERGLVIAREFGGLDFGVALGGLGNTYYELGESAKATACMQEAAEIFDAIGSPAAQQARVFLREWTKRGTG